MIRYFCAFIILLSTAFGYPSATNDKRCLNYCSNDGVCDIINNAPQCYCLPEWEGVKCQEIRETDPKEQEQEQEIIIMSRSNLRNDPCSLVPGLCKNGLCQFKDNKYTCACPYEYTGKRCEIESPCVGYCKNKGICTLINNGTDPNCNCTGTGFTGYVCSNPEPVTATTTASTTPDSRCAPLEEFCGKFGCRIVDDRPVCNCPPGTNPPFCDPAPTNPSSSSPPGSSSSSPPGSSSSSPPGSSSSSQPGSSSSSSSGPTNSPGSSTSGPTGTPQPGKTCANNPCRNSRPCYNTGNNYFCYCGSRYTGYDCETAL